MNGNCTLHNLNLEIAVPFSKVLKGINSGTDKERQHECRDVEQLLYSAFAWENIMLEINAMFEDNGEGVRSLVAY